MVIRIGMICMIYVCQMNVVVQEYISVPMQRTVGMVICMGMICMINMCEMYVVVQEHTSVLM